MSPSSSTVKYEIRDRVAWVTLNRPEAMNALNSEMHQAIRESFLEAAADDNVLVIILTGEGGKAFCAGVDLKEMSKKDSSGKITHKTIPDDDPVDDCPKPIIAAIDGFCLAGGFELILRCDIRIATEKSRFGLPEPRRSILAGYGLFHLSRMIPLGDAMWIQLTGSHMTAQRAYDIGLLQTLVPNREALFTEAEHLANEIKMCAPLAVQAIKHIVKVGRNIPIEYMMELAKPISEQIDKTEDRLEGPKAFVAKRAPNWKMR
jgi:enoyl-CoA hydratase/carnithine racemase